MYENDYWLMVIHNFSVDIEDDDNYVDILMSIIVLMLRKKIYVTIFMSDEYSFDVAVRECSDELCDGWW